MFIIKGERDDCCCAAEHLCRRSKLSLEPQSVSRGGILPERQHQHPRRGFRTAAFHHVLHRSGRAEKTLQPGEIQPHPGHQGRCGAGQQPALCALQEDSSLRLEIKVFTGEACKKYLEKLNNTANFSGGTGHTINSQRHLPTYPIPSTPNRVRPVAALKIRIFGMLTLHFSSSTASAQPMAMAGRFSPPDTV